MLRKSILLVLVLTALVALIFAMWPQVDLAVARHFHANGSFNIRSKGERLLRGLFFYGPFVVPLVMLGCWGLARLGVNIPAQWVPRGRSLVFVFASLLLLPGLLVNFVLKEHSGRPRPNQVIEFGGASEFRPWYRFDGACRSNCSFISGEVSASAWLTAPASLLPAPLKIPAMAAALAFAGATAYLRMNFGGHFLSDVLFAILLTLLGIQLLYLLLVRGGKTQL